jgi:formamidopyrimidine-DNA glycosylase
MPEGLEAAIYADAAFELVGHVVTSIEVDNRCAGSSELSILVGKRVQSVRRHGKRVALVLDDDQLELFFGMTGRLIINDVAPIGALEYGPSCERPEWDRLKLTTDVGSLRVNDPRRLARFTLNPDWSTLGVDFIADAHQLDDVLDRQRRRTAAVKSVLLDQRVIAGLGNMLVDEVLFSAGIDPCRTFASLSVDERRKLSPHISAVVIRLGERGGSHTGVLSPEVRASLLACPIDGAPLSRVKVSGRTTVFCSLHQR